MNDLNKPAIRWPAIVLSVFLLIAVTLGIFYVGKRQDIRNKAALTGATLSMNPSDVNKSAGSVFPVAVILNAGPDTVTGAELHVQYNPAILEITDFTPGKQLPVVLSQPSISAGNASVTLGAQPNVYLKGSDIIGTFTVKALSSSPTSITFTSDSKIAVLEKTTNALVSSTGIAINGIAPSPILMKCNGPDGSSCTMGTCPSGAMCKLQTGICSAGICRATVQCDGTNNGSYCKRCKPCTSTICPAICIEEIATCQNGQCSGNTIAVTPTPTPPVGCFYQQVQCVKAPCDPILVCPTPTPNSCVNVRNGSTCTIGSCPTCMPGKACPAIACKLQSGTCQNGQCVTGCVPLPSCVYNPPIVNGRPVICDPPPLPNGTTYCPRPSVTPSPTPYTQTGCYRAGCNGEVCTSNPAMGVSICTAKPEFACYRSARCEKQTNGACEWTQTNELRVCLAQYVTPTPTPSTGCYYKQVQCIQAPCNPVLVCPTNTPTPTPNTCIRKNPSITISPEFQSNYPGGTLNYNVTFVNNDTAGCQNSDFTLTPQVDTGWTYTLTNSTVPNVSPGQNAGVNFNVTSLSTLNVTSEKTVPVTVRIKNNTSQLTSEASAAYIVLPKATTQTIDIRVKLAGVTDGSAEGAKVGIKFVKLGGETLQLSTALPITHVGNGIYKAVADISNPLPYGTKFRIKVKGEKHTSVEYCYQVGQTSPCKDSEYITMPNFTAQTYGFDLTGLPLPPGDVVVQDGKVDASDFTKVKALMSKLCSDLTVQDKLIGDLDYNGCVTVKDIFLIRQTLETRYDE